MQNITPQLVRGAQVIESYGPAGFRIAGTDYAGSVLVTSYTTIAWPITAVESLTVESLAPLFDASPEVILLGTGARHEMIPSQIKQELKARGIGCDTMDTGAAARTFNVLLAEERKVAVALILPRVG